MFTEKNDKVYLCGIFGTVVRSFESKVYKYMIFSDQTFVVVVLQVIWVIYWSSPGMYVISLIIFALLIVWAWWRHRWHTVDFHYKTWNIDFPDDTRLLIHYSTTWNGLTILSSWNNGARYTYLFNYLCIDKRVLQCTWGISIKEWKDKWHYISLYVNLRPILIFFSLTQWRHQV